MNSADESHLEPYRQAVRHLGPDAPGFKAALWGSREAQLLRFDVMIDLGDFEKCTLLDIGCGTGDFAEHLLNRNVPFTRYIGVDALPELINTAESRGFARCEFHLQNVLAALDSLEKYQADFVTISGSLNTMDQDEARRLVGAAFHAANQGVIFNFLSDRAHEQWLQRDTGPARRFDTVAWLDWSFGLTPRVTFTQDYLNGHDATIMLRH